MNPDTESQLESPLEAKQGHLVISGLYRYIRHPLYTAGLIFIWLLPLMTVNILTINISLTLYILIGTYFEERKLRAEFGRGYIDYAAVTPMFIPFLKGNKKSQ
jgi:protein-S-isoprenylcysteine O-methyltransferase Ste14